MRKYSFYNDNIELYAEMIKDIDAAKEYVLLETYIFANDSVGKRFKRILLKKAREGLDVKILVDGYGSTANKKFFHDLIEAGGDARIFREFQWSFRIIKKNNFRNHRKLLVIDDKISYIGSSNITTRSLAWREANLRMVGDIAMQFKKVFLQNFNLFDKHFLMSKEHNKIIKTGKFEVIRDVPSLKYRKARRRMLKMIHSAKEQVMIEGAYFLPDFLFRRALKEARERGVQVVVIVPKYSDYRAFDLLREKYLGKLHEYGINIMLYVPEVLHSKVLVVDEKKFLMGSSNMDHRSFTLQFEINVFGTERLIIKKLVEHFYDTLTDCHVFDYEAWQRRTWAQRIIERLLSTIRYSM
jgi:cardiolipin synthase A/B